MIKLENCFYSVNNNSVQILKSINLQIKGGELLTIMGSNGSGKTSLVRLIAGLIKPTRGTIHKEFNKNCRLPIGMIFQNPDDQFVAMTVERELAFSLENMGYSPADMEKGIISLLSRFGIIHLKEKIISELSGGEKQKVAIASILIQKPSLLILDEPDSYVDYHSRKQLDDELKKIRAESPQLMIIRITQFKDVARQYGRLILLSEGEIVADKSPDEIFSNTELTTRASIGELGSTDRKLIKIYNNKNTSENKEPEVNCINISNISFSYSHDHEVIRNLSLDINRGEVLAIVGKTGQGKSTLGKMICSLIEPSDGRVFYLDKDGNHLSPKKLTGRVTATVQQPEKQFFLTTCMDELSFGLKNSDLEEDIVKMENLLALAGLDPSLFKERDPFTLSEGEKRRLALAVAISTEPDFIVFDEPTSGLDSDGIFRFIMIVQELRDSGKGIIVISHNREVIGKTTDNLLYLADNYQYSLFETTQFLNSPESGELFGYKSLLKENIV